MMSIRLAVACCCLVVGLSACGGGYEGTPNPIDASTSALRVASGGPLVLVPSELKRLEVTGGTRPYTATSANPSVALAFVSDSTLSIAAVKGDAAPVQVTVTDAKAAKATLTVTVTNSPQQGTFTISRREVAMAPGDSQTLSIEGGQAPFSVQSLSPNRVTATVMDRSLTLTGVSEGSNVEVRVSDSAGVIQSVWVTVAAPNPSPSGFALGSNMPANLSLRPRNSVTYTLGGGTPPYSVTTSDSAIVNPVVRGAALVLSTGVGGNATVTVSDAAGATLSQPIQVLTTTAPLALTQSALTGLQTTSVDVGVMGGLPPYSVVPNGAAVTVVGAAMMGADVLRIYLLGAGGPVSVSVRDAEGAVATTSVTVLAALSNLSLSPKAVTVSELLPAGSALPVRILGGKAPYQVFSSHPNLLTATASGDSLLIEPPDQPCVDTSTQVVITVIDATGAAATTTVTVVDNGPCGV